MEYRLTSSGLLTNFRSSRLRNRLLFGAFALFLLTFSGCKCKKGITSQEIIKEKDTIYQEKIVEKRVPYKVTVEKQAECDSLGIVKDFTQTVTSETGTVTITSIGGVIRTEASFEGCVSEMIKQHRESMRINFKTVEVPVEVNKPWKSKWFWFSILLNVLLLMWIFRRFIPFLSWIPF